MRLYFQLRNLFLVLLFAFLGFLPTVYGQTSATYGNEWINYNQPYYKIKVVKNGMHRLTFADLSALGITNVNPQKFQIYRRGQEVAIYVNGQADQIFNAGDYIDFYGERNDGKLDVEMYKDPAHQVHNYYSLFTDTAAYFLTWSNQNGKRMQEKVSNSAGLTPEPRHYAEAFRLYTSTYNYGEKPNRSWHDLSEGFFGDLFGTPYYAIKPSRQDTISGITNLDPTGRPPVLEAAVVGYFINNSHKVKFLLNPPSGPTRILTTASSGPTGVFAFPTLNYRKPKFTLLPTDVSSAGVLKLKVTVPDSTGPNFDFVHIAYYRLIYAQTNNLNNSGRLILTDSTKTTPSYLLFDNPPANAIAYDITDPYNVIRTEGNTVGTQKGFVFDPLAKPRRILIVNQQSTISAAGIARARFRQFSPTAVNYIIVTHPSLHKPVAGTPYTDPPKDYATYRASAAGGSYNPIVLDVDSVYNQFHYGEKSPAAITNLMNWLRANGQPQHLLLLGKGLDLGALARSNSQDLVPTAGAPASDVLFTSDWKNNKYAPRVPTGRVSASTSEDIVNYLEKVKAHERLGVEDWRKNILHLGGGHDAGEVSSFTRYLSNYENKAEGPFLGAKVKSILRGDLTTPTTYINVKNEVNAGLSLITFFGHSSAAVSDIDIGFVTDPINGYTNLNKYPMILMNGCVAGNAFQLKNGTNQKYSFGEDWTLAPQKGSILFIGATTEAVPYALNNYSNSFYTTAFTDSAYYGKPIGEILQKTIERSAGLGSPNDLNNITVLTSMVLQGDPALRLFSPNKPDYLVKADGLKIQSIPVGSNVNAGTETFDLVIDIKNTGKALDTSLVVSVKRTLPNGDTIRYASKTIPAVYNEASVKFTIDNKNVNSFGNNTFEVTLDYGNHIQELDETNNKKILKRYFSASGVLALLPYEYSIINTQQVKLIGQPANLLSGPRDYYFELDTIPTFKSAVKKSAVVKNATVKPSWTTTLLQNTPPKDSVVYYWRVRFNTFTPEEDTIWAVSSFRYIPNSPEGWSQSHYGQFANDNLTTISQNIITKEWEYPSVSREMQLKAGGGSVPFTIPGQLGILVDNSPFFDGTCINGNGFLITVYNNKTLQPYTGIKRNICGYPTSQTFYTFSVATPALIDTVASFLQRIPSGYYVSLINVNNVPFSTFTASQKAAFKLIGSKMIDTLKTGYPFAIVGQKGSGNGILLAEKTYDPTISTLPKDQIIAFTVNIQGHQKEGTIVSIKIGPATSWTTLHHTVKKTGKDEYTLDLYGFDKQGTRTLITPNITNPALSLSSVDATVYPYLQLQLATTDTLDRTPPQLKQWMVVYQGVPEGILRTDQAVINQNDIDKQASKGNVKLKFAFVNISNRDFADSLTIIRSVAGNRPIQDTIKVKKLLANDSVYFEYSIPTGGMKGLNMARVEVNPEILPEQYYFNNFLEIPFSMPNADLHPLLDVAFDGIHIMDGDIVSPSPKIGINLKDEDKYDYVTDPDKLEVFLLRPGALNYERIDLRDATLVTLPNTSDPNRDKRDFTLTYNPKNLPDGIYKLRVQGSDNSNNNAGFDPYTISFEVINESSITHFYPYPNPFTSNTRFVFTLTGNPENMPRNLKIQIMTLTGKVVREIQKEELGFIRVGNNISAPWDGTDEYGDKLANGTYLYRVVMEAAPMEEMKHRKTSGDKSFKKEYGKLYILR